MARLSEQLEREAEIARTELAGDLDELRRRMTPGQIVDEVADYARDTPLAEFFGNLARDIRDNPLPLLLIGIGVGWAMLSSSRRSRPPGEPAAAATGPLGVWRPQPAAPPQRSEWEVAAVAPAADS